MDIGWKGLLRLGMEGHLDHVANSIPTDQRPESFLVRLFSTTGVIPLQRPDGKEKEQAGLCFLPVFKSST
jgi:hypothetical protein